MALPTLPAYRMPFEPMTIDHLGLRLYSTLPPVISEIVSNGWDAEAPRVEVTIPVGPIKPGSEVVIRDYGHGMSPQELADEYLPIGRPRRGPDDGNAWSKNKKRRVTGRKGLGKLSAFGVATEMEVRAIQRGVAVCLRLNYDLIKKWMRDHPGEDYAPDVVPGMTGTTNEADGLSVTLRNLHRKSPMNSDDVRRGLARRLEMIGAGFDVVVNGKSVGPGDRISQDQCAAGFSWSVGDMPQAGGLAGDRTVAGWIGFLASSSQANRGVDIYASRKAVELGSFFNFPSTHAQFARAHLVGEIHADFLDAETDLISTARNSVVWESDAGQQLQSWGHAALKWAFDQWIELRRKEKEEVVIKAAKFDEWLKTRPQREQKVAGRLVGILVNDVNLDPLSAQPLLEIVKSSVESMAFHELVDTIENEGATAASLLKLFDEWRVIEAREHLKLADGRMSAIEQLDTLMESGGLEVQQLQPLFDKHPWLIDPAWHEADRQATYTKLLKANAIEKKDLDEADRRLDIFCIRSGGGAVIVELKKPKKKLAREDLEQIERYVDWARENIVGTGADSPKYVQGLLLVGELNARLQQKIARLQGSDIRVETFADLRDRAKEYYGLVEKRLADIAPEYLRSRRKSKPKP